MNDVTMGVYCGVIPSLSHNSFDEWVGHMEHFNISCDEATTTVTI